MDTSRLHNKPLQLLPTYGPREVRVPCTAPTGNQGRMPHLAQISGKGKVMPITVQMEVAPLASSQVQQWGSSVSSHEDLLPQDLLHHVGFILPVPMLNITWVIQLLLMVSSSHYPSSLARSRVPRDGGAKRHPLHQNCKQKESWLRNQGEEKTAQLWPP